MFIFFVPLFVLRLGAAQPVFSDTGRAVPSAMAPVAAAVLTDSLLTRYLAVRRALRAFCTAHPMHCTAARTQAHPELVPMAAAGMTGTWRIEVVDAVAWAAQEPMVATLCAHEHLRPHTLALIQRAVYQALWALGASHVASIPLDTTGVMGTNTAVVHAHQQALAEVGDVIRWGYAHP